MCTRAKNSKFRIGRMTLSEGYKFIFLFIGKRVPLILQSRTSIVWIAECGENMVRLKTMLAGKQQTNISTWSVAVKCSRKGDCKHLAVNKRGLEIKIWDVRGMFF